MSISILLHKRSRKCTFSACLQTLIFVSLKDLYLTVVILPSNRPCLIVSASRIVPAEKGVKTRGELYGWAT